MTHSPFSVQFIEKILNRCKFNATREVFSWAYLYNLIKSSTLKFFMITHLFLFISFLTLRLKQYLRIINIKTYLLPVTYLLRARWHKASTLCLHMSLLCAAVLASPHVFHPAVILSFSAVRRHVVFGRPRFLLPSGNHFNAVTQSLSLSFLKMCPMYRHLLHLKSLLILSNPALSNTSSLLIWSCHLIFKILRRHLWWNVSTFFSSPLSIFHVY